MDKHIITETVNGVTNYISLNGNGELVSVGMNPMELPGFMTKEQAFKVVAGLRQAAAGTDKKYRVKAVSQALRDMITDIIVNKLPETPMVDEAVIAKAVESWKPKVEAKAEKAEEASPEAEPAAENPEDSEAFVSEADCCEEPAEAEAEVLTEKEGKPEKKAKKGKK